MPAIGSTARLIFGSLGLACLVAAAGADLARAQSKGAPAASGKASSAPKAAAPAGAAPAVQAPAVTLEVAADRDGVERNEPLAVVVILTNKADVELRGVKISVLSAAFQPPVISAPAPPTVPAFRTVHHPMTLTSMPQATFGAHKVPVMVEYTWPAPTGGTWTSAQTAMLTVQVKRRFEEEGKGLPGGTAVFLYLLLPVVPAFLAYDVLERLRKGEGLTMPKFGTEHIMPAFLLALVLSIAVATAVNFNVELAYTNPRLFLGVIAFSAGLGAAIPAGRFMRGVQQRWRWAFKNGEPADEYLRKALLGPRTSAEFVWVEGTAGGETWKGVKLLQPNGTAVVLGARVQVTTPDSAGPGTSWQRLTTEVFHGAGDEATLADRRLLVKMVKAGTVTVSRLESIVRGTNTVDGFVAVGAPAQLQTTATTAKPLVQVIR